MNPASENFILKRLWTFLTNIFSAIGEILSYINPFSENFILTNIISGIGNILSYLNPFSDNFFGYKIIDLLKSALEFLFVPSEARINALINLVTSKIAFVDSIKIAVESLKNIINNLGNPPALQLSIGATPYTEAQTLTIIDFSWYAPFKNYGDLVITGFAYAFFLWRLFITIPGILNGQSGQILGDYQAGWESYVEGKHSGKHYRKGKGGF